MRSDILAWRKLSVAPIHDKRFEYHLKNLNRLEDIAGDTKWLLEWEIDMLPEEIAKRVVAARPWDKEAERGEGGSGGRREDVGGASGRGSNKENVKQEEQDEGEGRGLTAWEVRVKIEEEDASLHLSHFEMMRI
ncbi:hypothetical protein CC1G_12396 [Coprinopsis cinerea okayama7|uniref:Uncharacterized protein n=1 Tax=Coprinopsis cinerea (strain Okayama-7 / 130 / ATCC MYA-4618 / FGSC 9003) TaxID=240176 RepID=A8P350_COPC7|nr:hypothetical protein CC1G_12396 [Coprinopsis cinerea okayama7\|eukprot:XP_001838472.1 hypothetical protein CC1G_12396 [Coprinopsis cinerea okayama7\